ncbi:MAG: hypothetical protein NUW01_14295 [Gemmatimonadaceae bacterium]|nr:hypothetical protein [Gemmatimonadaceae bacterium]
MTQEERIWQLVQERCTPTPESQEAPEDETPPKNTAACADFLAVLDRA